MGKRNNKKNRYQSSDDPLISRRKLLASLGLSSLGLSGLALLPGCSQAEGQKLTHTRGSADQDRHNIKDYGAVGDREADDSKAFQNAIDAIAAEGKGVLYIPAGDYRIDQKITKSLKSWSLTITGDGQGVSNIYCSNSDGVFQFSHSSRSSQITVHDLSFFTELKGGGTAIQISQPERGNLHNRSLVIQNVEMRGVNIAEDYFDYGIRSIGQWRPLFLNVIFAGPFGPNATLEDHFRATCGIEAIGTYAPSFQHCYMWSAQTGYRVKSTREGPNPEDCAFYRSFAVGCKVGIDIYTTSNEPQLEIDTCHINCWEVGIRLHQRKYFSITNCLLYNVDWDDRMPEYRDILLEDSFGGIITDNIFHQPANSNRTLIDFKGSSYDIQIKDNLFNAKGTAIAVTSTGTGVVATNNQYTDQVTQVLDDSSSDLVFKSSEFRGVGLHHLATQNIPNDTWTPVVWKETEYDTEHFWTGSDHITIPKNKGIRYVRLSANINWEDNNAGSRRVEFSKNGESNFFGNDPKYRLRGSGDLNRQHMQSPVIPVKGGDLLQVRVMQTSGRELRLNPDHTWFSVEVVEG